MPTSFTLPWMPMGVGLALLAACASEGRNGAGADAADAAPRDAARDEGESVPRDGSEEGGRSGPLTFVATELAVSAERRCDLDGDGSPENAVADLLSPSSSLFAMTLSTIVQGNIDAARIRVVMHFPWVDDVETLADAETRVIIFDGEDGDDGSLPDHADDDFSGEETYAVRWRFLDACGEPLSFLADVSIDDGQVTGERGRVPVLMGDKVGNVSLFWAHGAQLSGEIRDGGASASFSLCGYSLVSELGAIEGTFDSGDLSLLEGLLFGGASFGVPSVPGLEPDIDVDGDGLEGFVQDEFGNIVRCIDGDRTPIEGNDCWSDPRMADAFSLGFELETVPARFDGREPGWEDAVEGTCEEGPPEQSLFDPA